MLNAEPVADTDKEEEKLASSYEAKRGVTGVLTKR